jgi:plastocyanin
MRSPLPWITTVLVLGSACRDAAPEPVETPTPEGVFGVAPLPVGGTPSIVTLEGPGLAAEVEPTDMAPRIDQHGLAFDPTQLIVHVGDTVVFSNSETLSHNVHMTFADTDSMVMNHDTDPGGRVAYVFEREGGYDIVCDEHPGMRSFVYATAAPRAVFADRDGGFLLPDVPSGSYTLSIWSIDAAQRQTVAIDVSGPSTQVSLVPAR